MQTWNYSIGLLVLTILMSCQYDPYAHNYTTTEPMDSDLIGTYTLEKQTVDYNITEFKDSINNRIVIPKIEVKSNGTYTVVNFPVFETWNSIFTGLITQSGKWTKTTVGSIGDGTGALKNHWGMHFYQLPKGSQNVGLMHNKQPYKLIFGFGDPDEGRVMLFKKE